MNDAAGFFYLNAANSWPGFRLHDIAIAPDGSLRLTPGHVLPASGVFRGGPFAVMAGPTPWYRLRADAEPLPQGTHLQLFTFAANDGDAPYYPAADQPFTAPGWHAAPLDSLDALILHPPAQRLWIGGLLRSNGQDSPVLHQMRVDYGRDTYVKYLPALYRGNDRQRELLERFLSLHESVLGGLEDAIATLPHLFDPFATPAGDFPAWLSWLAQWLAFDLNETWSVAQKRQYLSKAFQLYDQRGTLCGIETLLRAWLQGGLNEQVCLILTDLTRTYSDIDTIFQLAPAAPQDKQSDEIYAQLGVNTVLGEGPPFFFLIDFLTNPAARALRHPAGLDAVQRAARFLLDAEKPAHTYYQLRVRAHTMQLAEPGQTTIGGGPGAQIGETTLLWDEPWVFVSDG